MRCPAICRDEIKEGMVHAASGFTPAPGDELTRRTYPTFFEVLRVLLVNGVTVVAEAAFQDKVWRAKLEPLAQLAELRVVQCHTDPDIARTRIERRAISRNAHADNELLDALRAGDDYFTAFDRLSMTPCIDVDTTSGYDPGLDVITEFVNRGAP
jgi:predicted kinase